MQYFVLPLFLIVFFELIGQVTCSFLNIKKFNLSVIMGAAAFFGTYQIIAYPLAYKKVSFETLLVVDLLFVFVWILIIAINNRKIKLNYNKKLLLVVLIIFIVEILFTLRYAIGSMYRYDTIAYSNMITGNIYKGGLGKVDSVNGGPGNMLPYVTQGIYHMCSSLFYVAHGIFNKCGIEFFYFTEYTWCFSIVLYVIHAELAIDLIEYFKIKNKKSIIFILVFFVLFIFNYYWNSQQAYLGNSFRMAFCSYMFVYTFEYFINKNNGNLWAFLLLNYANVGFAASNITLAIIYVFGLWLLIDNQKNSYRILVLTLVIPMACLAYFFEMGITKSQIVGLIFLCLALLEIPINFIADKLKLKKVLPIVVGATLIIGSLLITKNPLDISDFINNMSGADDMTWSYTDISKYWMVSGNIVYWILLIILFTKIKDNKALKVVLLIAVIFFNPWAAAIQNLKFITFYRNYDIVINFSTIVLAISYLENIKYEKYLITGMLICTLIAFYGYYNYEPETYFKIEKGYNKLLRMYDDEAETIRQVKEIIKDNDSDWIRTISSIYQIRTEIPKVNTLYGRGKKFSGLDGEYESYKVFYPADYYGDPFQPKNPQYDKVCEFIDTFNYDLIIQSKSVDYYDEESNTYYPLTYLINKCGHYPDYENDSFAVYYYK